MKTLHYRNGTSSLLPTTPGFYISAGACGGGKSYNIINLAKTHAGEGVLIVASTIESAAELAGSIPGSFCLHSKNIPAIGQYRQDPRSLASKDVLIVTSPRIIIDPIELFLNYRVFSKRQWVLIDELITFYPEPYQVPSKIIDALTYVNTSKRNSIGEIMVGGKKYYQHFYKDLGSMGAAVKKSSIKLFRNDGLGEYKTKAILKHVLSHGLTPIKQNIIEEASKYAKVILFDATSDIVFPGSTKILPTTGDKYSSDIEFIQFGMPLKRKNKESDFDISELKRYASDVISMIVGLSKKEKVLVVTWKDIQTFKPSSDPDQYESIKTTHDNFPELFKDLLVKYGGVDSNIACIYRGCGLDRGSNQYQDYASIVFLGEWRIPDTITKDIASMFGVKKVKFEDYKLAMIIQTICRLRIRQHTGFHISVYYSSDCSYQLFYRAQEYFRANSKSCCNIAGITTPCKTYTRPQKGFVVDIVALYSVVPSLKDAVMNNKSFSFRIPLDDLYKAIPRDEKKRSRYKSLINYLNTKKLTLIII